MSNSVDRSTEIAELKTYISNLSETDYTPEDIKKFLRDRNVDYMLIDQLTRPYFIQKLTKQIKVHGIISVVSLIAGLALIGFFLYGKHLNELQTNHMMQKGKGIIYLKGNQVLFLRDFRKYDFLISISKGVFATGFIEAIRTARFYIKRKHLRKL